jgi:hypothetical protein
VHRLAARVGQRDLLALGERQTAALQVAAAAWPHAAARGHPARALLAISAAARSARQLLANRRRRPDRLVDRTLEACPRVGGNGNHGEELLTRDSGSTGKLLLVRPPRVRLPGLVRAGAIVAGVALAVSWSDELGQITALCLGAALVALVEVIVALAGPLD